MAPRALLLAAMASVLSICLGAPAQPVIQSVLPQARSATFVISLPAASTPPIAQYVVVCEDQTVSPYPNNVYYYADALPTDTEVAVDGLTSNVWYVCTLTARAFDSDGGIFDLVQSSPPSAPSPRFQTQSGSGSVSWPAPPPPPQAPPSPQPSPSPNLVPSPTASPVPPPSPTPSPVPSPSPSVLLPPGKPLHLVVQPMGGSSISLSWAAPAAVAGAAAVVSYKLGCSSSPVASAAIHVVQTTLAAAATPLQVRFDALHPADSYTCSARSIAADGSESDPAAGSAIPSQTSAPIISKSAVSTGSVTLTFAPPTNAQVQGEGYAAVCEAKAPKTGAPQPQTVVVGKTATSVTLKNLPAGESRCSVTVNASDGMAYTSFVDVVVPPLTNPATLNEVDSPAPAPTAVAPPPKSAAMSPAPGVLGALVTASLGALLVLAL